MAGNQAALSMQPPPGTTADDLARMCDENAEKDEVRLREAEAAFRALPPDDKRREAARYDVTKYRSNVNHWRESAASYRKNFPPSATTEGDRRLPREPGEDE